MLKSELKLYTTTSNTVQYSKYINKRRVLNNKQVTTKKLFKNRERYLPFNQNIKIEKKLNVPITEDVIEQL